MPIIAPPSIAADSFLWWELDWTDQGVLHLVDLAGSERLDRSGVGNDAQRLRETQSINKSLSCLADVFSSLSSKASHVPFRNSKLTYLMQVRPLHFFCLSSRELMLAVCST